MTQRRLGIVGGIGPESTIEYYREILKLHAEKAPEAPTPAILIDSIDVKTGLVYLDAGDHAALVEYLLASLQRLKGGGADFAMIAANSPHVVFDELQRRSPLPLVSIVEAAAGHARRNGFRRLGLLGTRFTMSGGMYPEAFARVGLTIASPHPDEQMMVHDIYIGELLEGKFLPESRSRVLALCDRMAARDGIEAMVLGGTELPLLLGMVREGVPLLDTTRIHAAAVVERLIGN